MPDTWRLVDTGLASPARNIALNRALLEARAADEIASTLRFARSTRCALVAARHSPAQELDLDYCREQRIAQQRRLTGGPAVYVDERQLVWELYLHRRDVGSTTLHALGRRICHAAATAISALGVDARLRNRSEIEVDGRALGHGGFAIEGDAILFQGVLLLDTDPDTPFAVLRTPWSGAAAANAESGKRVTSLGRALGRKPDARSVKANLAEAFESEFGVEFRDADLGLSEHARCEAAMPAIDARDWLGHTAGAASEAPLLAAVHRAAAGALEVAVIYERAARTVRRAWFTGGTRFEPARLLPDLEAALCDVPLARVAARVEWFFGSRTIDAGGFSAADFVAGVKRAIRQPLLADNS